MSFPTFPHGHTAMRLTWPHLPPATRARIEELFGTAVVQADSQDAGFTPGFASILTGADGRRIFVKAAHPTAQREFAAAYREEAAKLTALGPTTPAPPLLWVDDEDWLVLAFEAVDAHNPHRPWRQPELDRALALAGTFADLPIPEELGLLPLWDDLPELVEGWNRVDSDHPQLAELRELAGRLPGLPADTMVHADLRDDNILLCADGRTLACDWNWPALGPAWIDAVTLMISAWGDGLDAEALLAQNPQTRDVDPDDIDAWLAGFAGFMELSRHRPVPPSSPYLRTHQAWYAEAALGWLTHRRNWT